MSDGLALRSVLVSGPALRKILAIARAIPDLGDTIGLECRLGPAAGVVDLGIGIRRRVRRSPNDARPPAPVWGWKRFAQFCDTWLDPTSLVHAWTPFVFLEFDGDAPRRPIPVPSVFVTLDWPMADPAEPEAERGVRRLTAAVLRDALERLLGADTLSRLARRLDACIDGLPDGGRVVHAGAMLGRPTCGARLSIAMPRTSQAGYLDRVGLRSVGNIVESIMTGFAPEDDRVHLELDVGERIGPRVGVVLACDEPATWARLLERVAGAALCTPAEKSELLRWPRISHLKITPGAAGQLEAKAYLLLDSEPDGTPASG